MRGTFRSISATVVIVLAFTFSFSAPAPPGFAQARTDQWTQIGVGLIGHSDTGGPHNESGRAIQAAWRKDALQDNQNILWIGTHWGGLWKSILDANGNIGSWIPLTDNFPGPHDMGSFLVNRSDSNQILIGTGKPASNGVGDGNIYRTTDQGATWLPNPLPHRPKRITRMVDDSSDPDGNIVLAATSGGIYRSKDFGKSKWKRVYDGAEVTDIVQDVDDSARWYAAALISHVILRSTDNGVTWTPPEHSDNGFHGSIRRVSLAACGSNKNVLYALAANKNAGGKLNGLYRSTDRGETWSVIYGPEKNCVVDKDIQGVHTCAIGCDPTNASHIFFGMQLPLETFTALLPPQDIHWIGEPSDCSISSSTLNGGHGDYNYILFRPGFQSIVIANDGGYYIYHPDPGGTVPGTVDDSGNLLGIEANFLKISNGGLASSRSSPNIFIGGVEDNGLIVGDTAENTLTISHTADGGQGSIMPDNPDILAGSINGDNTRFKSTDRGQSWTSINHGLDGQNFSSVLIDPTANIDDPHIFTPTQNSLGLSNVFYRNVSDPTSADWQLVSPLFLNGVIDHLDHTTDRDVDEIIVTLENSRKLFTYTGPRSLLGLLFLKQITPKPLPAVTNGIRDASANADKSGLQPDTIYYTTGKSRPSRAFISTDGGQHWGDVTGDMPQGNDGPDFLKLIANPKNLIQLFLATSTGVYRSDTEGLHWYPYSEGLRLNEEVLDIVINVHDLAQPTLYIGTKGRGFWQRIVQ